MDPYQQRREKLAHALKSRGVDAYVACAPVTMDYLAGFREDGGERFMALVVGNDASLKLFCPALSVNQASRSGLENLEGFPDGVSARPSFEAYFRNKGFLGQVAVDDEMRSAQLLNLQEWLPGVTWRPGSRILAEVARAKDPWELAQLQAAGEIADEAYARILLEIRAGQTEKHIARRLAALMEEQGGTPSFAIVAVGPASAEPHHHPDDRELKSGDVLVLDFGCSVNGYHSDTTRTIALGAPEPESFEVYKIVLKAHKAAREMIRPGVLNGDIDQAARRVIESAGYGEFFVHRTGHGLGMRIHEEPNIVPGGKEQVEAGDCFSIEPGIYLPGRFGVRIENIVSVTAEEHHSFNAEPPEELVQI